MTKHRLLILFVVTSALLIVISVGCILRQSPQDTYYDTEILDKAEATAEDFVRNSPTFTYDGIEDSLVLVSRCPFCWSIIFEFDSAHSGYGDRTGQVLSQVITHHSAQIYVNTAVVTSSYDDIEIVDAVMDSEWDMINQELLN